MRDYRQPLLALAALGLLAIGAPVVSRVSGETTVGTQYGRAGASAQRFVTGPGLVEPVGEEREVASQVIGVLSEVRIEENDAVVAGQIIAVVENSEQRARLAVAEATLALRKAQLDKVVNGARPEERREARAALAEMEANLDLAHREYDRKAPLAKTGASSVAALDLARSTLAASEARRAVMAERVAILDAGSRIEDIAAARAQLALAEADVALAQSLLDKTFIRSPIAGTVLRRLRIAGEAVTNIDPTPVAIVGDLGGLRIRAEIDETDVGRVVAGQRVEVTADAYPGRRFGGTVFRVSQRLGGKAVKTGRPAEKVDMKVLQVLIDLDAGANLPVGLRVDAYISMQ